MKILMINYEYPPLGGGGGAFTRDLAEELAKNNEIDVLTTHFKGLKKKEIINGVTVYRVPVLFRKSLHAASLPSLLSFPPSAIINGLKLLKDNKYDMIYTHFAVPSGPAGIFFSRFFGIPNVLSLHGGDVYNPSRKISPHRHAVLRWTVRTVLNNATEIIAHSEIIKDKANRIYKPLKEIRIIPYGIPKNRYCADEPRGAFSPGRSALYRLDRQVYQAEGF